MPVHGYDRIEDATLWEAIPAHRPDLRKQVPHLREQANVAEPDRQA